jgi:peroxiredoxin Q/BCP
MTATVDRPAPDFELPATGEDTVRLSDLRGEAVVLYFYPRDNTPGCTREGQDFGDLHDAFRAAGARVLGVSRDSVRKHENFKAKYGFPFPLLADEDETACRDYGVLKEKKLYGKTHIGIERSTFLIDAEGVLRREWRGVKVEGHANEVLAAVRDF